MSAPGGAVRRYSSRWRLRIPALIAALGITLTFGLPWGQLSTLRDRTTVTDAGLPTGEDPLQRRVLAQLAMFTHWLEANSAEGYIGEVGIPGDGDDRWLELGRKWFTAADGAGLWVDAWSVGEWWGIDYGYSPFTTRADGGPVAVQRPSGALLAEQARTSSEPRGVNVSGGEFGAPGGTETVSLFSNQNPGVYGRDYQYASRATFDYLASRGLDTVRLPFRWERIQPRLGAELDPIELERLRETVRHAHLAGLGVVLDVHNFGAYHLFDGGLGVRRPIGSDEVPRNAFADLWSRLSAAFHDDPGVIAYDLMNEPVALHSLDGTPPARLWEVASQDAVSAIRDRGDGKLIMIPGYSWSHAGEWAQHHPRAWIDDPADNIRYTAHHYWQHEADGSYDSEVARASATGY